MCKSPSNASHTAPPTSTVGGLFYMAAVPEPPFYPPNDVDTPVWRYMDFTKLVALLSQKSLYFCRIDLLGDPYEGVMPASEQFRQFLNTAAGLQYPGGPDKFSDLIIGTLKQNQKRGYVNCWHLSAVESAAMWRLYAKSDEAVAIKSTYRKLDAALPPSVKLGVVNYIDFKNVQLTMPVKPVEWYMFKRKSFQHEREVRALIYLQPPARALNQLDTTPTAEGMHMVVNLNDLIEEVYVAPSSPKWFFNLVCETLRHFGVRCPCIESDLAKTPVW